MNFDGHGWFSYHKVWQTNLDTTEVMIWTIHYSPFTIHYSTKTMIIVDRISQGGDKMNTETESE